MTEHEVALELGRQLERYLRTTSGIMNDEHEGNFMPTNAYPLLDSQHAVKINYKLW
jgi:hypothetical protein